MRSHFYLLALTTCAISTISIPAYAANVSDIRVIGSERVEPATVMSYLNLKKGDAVTQDALDAALKSLFATGLFADVQVGENNGVVTVTIVENPVINEVAFEGNDDLKDEQLQGEIQARARQVFTRTSIQDDVARLYSIYQKNGRFSADIQPKIIKLDQNRVNLVFEISEGPVTEIDSIRFVGNDRFSGDQLRSVVSSKESHWYSILSSNDKYDQDRLGYDQELLRQFYLKEGYADFRVLSAVSELSQEKDKFFVTMTIDEGARYRINDVRINSQIRNLDPAILKDSVNFKVADWYNGEEVKDSIDTMTQKLGDLQYAFVSVVPDINRNRENHTIDVIFNINETPRVFVERINVNGNVRTLDKVVRRQIELSEG
ncbi:MAG: outer membrane protein assembly factor BamA, partial [Pseudomonadota bacterium]